MHPPPCEWEATADTPQNVQTSQNKSSFLSPPRTQSPSPHLYPLHFSYAMYTYFSVYFLPQKSSLCLPKLPLTLNTRPSAPSQPDNDRQKCWLVYAFLSICFFLFRLSTITRQQRIVALQEFLPFAMTGPSRWRVGPCRSFHHHQQAPPNVINHLLCLAFLTTTTTFLLLLPLLLVRPAFAMFRFRSTKCKATESIHSVIV